MTPSELKAFTEKEEPFFFSPKTMKLFGDRMSNYGVRSATIDTYSTKNVDCWELYRKQPVKYGLCDSAYFDKANGNRLFRVN